MTGNLPPGVTAQDIDDHFGPSTPDHDHHWMPAVNGAFILEDGAAIFPYVCDWAPTKSVDMGRHGTEYIKQGEECGAESSVRLETDADREAVEALETAGINDTLRVAECDPPGPERQSGRLVVQADEYQVVYESD